MKTILVPCDFSRPAVNAFQFALDVAAQTGGTIYLLNVLELPMMYDTTLMPPLYFEEAALKGLAENSRNEFEKLIQKHNKENIKVVSKVEFGVTTQLISHYVTKHSIDLIVMGSHGMSGFKEHFIGSTAERVVRNATVPVIVLKDFFKGQIKNIVFPNSLELENQEGLITKIKALQHFFHAMLHIVWVNTPANFISDKETHERLHAFTKRYMLKDFTINIFNDYFEEDGIIEFAHLIKGDMIAMGTHGRRGVNHLISGSLTEDIVNHVDKLVWAYSLKNESSQKTLEKA